MTTCDDPDVCDAELSDASVCDAACVRARIAEVVLRGDGEHDEAPCAATLGDVTLLPHQREAVRRVRRALAEFGGALLADDVGLGKTLVALAVARDAAAAGAALVVAPAALRGTWQDAMRHSNVRLPFVSIESLGRRRRGRLRRDPAATRHALVVVDEAHHARNPATRRYQALAALTDGARVLLLSATPVHNRGAELRALLALFLGARAARLDGAALARCIVRRRADAVRPAGTAAAARSLARPPRVLPVHALHPAVDDALLARLLALPPPVPSADGGTAAALVALGLVRQWASSTAALRGALRRRLARAVALAASVRAGRLPTTAELRRAVVAGDVVQLEFPELLTCAVRDGAELLDTLAAHEAALRALLHDLGDAVDAARAACLRVVRAAHPSARIVAFSAYADTVAALHRLLQADGGVCALTAHGARVAGGRLTRREALHRFAPQAHGRPPPAPAEAVTLLLATDVLSEGISLHDASVVVHLDLPWTPARLAQRVGRVARLGSAHAAVAVYAMMPPASGEAWLGAERRLRAKLGESARLVGAADAVLPESTAGGVASVGRAPSDAVEELRRLVERWRRDGLHVGADDAAPVRASGVLPHVPTPQVAAVRAPSGSDPAFLALVGEPPRLVAGPCASGRTTDDPALLCAVARRAGGASVAPMPDAVRTARAAVDAWRTVHDAELALGPGGGALPQARVLQRIAHVVAGTPRDRRVAVAALAAAARQALAGPLGAGAEHRLARLAEAEMRDEPWLRAVAAIGGGSARAPGETPSSRSDVLHALLLVQPDPRLSS